MVRRSMMLVAVLLACLWPTLAAVQTTTISGKVLMPNGVIATAGTVRAVLSTQGGTLDGSVSHFVGGFTVSTIAGDGTVTAFSLVPNDAIVPAGTYYEVIFDVTAPIRTSWTVKWSIATTPDPIDIGAITRLDLAPGLTPVTCMTFLTAQWNPNENSDGFVSLAGGSPIQTTEAASDDVVIPYPLRFSTFYALVATAPDNGGGLEAWTLTLRSDLASTAVACTIADAATTCLYSGPAVQVPAGSKVDLMVTRTGTPFASLEMLVSVCGAP